MNPIALASVPLRMSQTCVMNTSSICNDDATGLTATVAVSQPTLTLWMGMVGQACVCIGNGQTIDVISLSALPFFHGDINSSVDANGLPHCR